MSTGLPISPSNVDKIELDFPGLGPNGVLAAARFHVGAAAADHSDRIIYNPEQRLPLL